MRSILAGIGVCALYCAPMVRADVIAGQKDDFEDGSLMSWRVGSVAGGTQPVNIASGGPGGADDNFLQMTTVGGFGPLSMMVVFNNERWVGTYRYIDAIELDLKNLGDENLQIRLAFADHSFNQYSLTTPIPLAANGAWTHARIELQAALFTDVGGMGDFSRSLRDIREVRILHSSTPNTGIVAEPVATTLGIDNITAFGKFAPPGFADFDFNAVVDHQDFLTLHENFGQAGSFADGDVNGDGQVDFADFQLLERSFGTALAGAPVEAASVPEPALVGVVGMLMVMGRRRRYNQKR